MTGDEEIQQLVDRQMTDLEEALLNPEEADSYRKAILVISIMLLPLKPNVRVLVCRHLHEGAILAHEKR